MRKEREAAPAIEPAEPAKNWFYADDPTGHVASIYFDEASTRLSEDDEDLREFPTEQSVRRQCNRSNYRANRFVAALGSLRAGHSDRRYPPPAP